MLVSSENKVKENTFEVKHLQYVIDVDQEL